MPKMLTLLDSKCEEIVLDGGESYGLQNSLSGQLCCLGEYKNSQKQVAKPRKDGLQIPEKKKRKKKKKKKGWSSSEFIIN